MKYQENALELTSLSQKAIEDSVMKSVELSSKITALQGEAFLATFIHYFHNNPDAVLFVNGQTGEYTDEGYSGCWIARIDPVYVQKRAETALKDGGWYAQRLDSEKGYNKNALDFANNLNDQKQFELLPRGIEGLAQKEFNIFGIVNGLERAWREVGDFLEEDSNGGMVYGKGDLGTIAKKIGVGASRFQELKAMVECEALTSGSIDKKTVKNKSREKVL